MSNNNQNFIKITSINDIIDAADRSKLEHFIKIYKEKTNKNLNYIVCSPGRVNLIGDHVDYHGFPVLPMAIKSSIWLGCSFYEEQDESRNLYDSAALENANSFINLMNIDEENFPNWTGRHSFAYGADLNKSHEWQNYFLCGYHGILAKQLLNISPIDILKHANRILTEKSLLDESNKTLIELKSLQVLVDSDLPNASGLSSSSALVCASAIATQLLLYHSKKLLIKNIQTNLDSNLNLADSGELAEYCSKFEHLIGTQGGGMDQAVILTAQQGYAKYVEFLPKLRCENVHLPENTVWLVSHCGSSYAKAATHGFNTRVLETKLGAAIIAKSMGFNSSSGIKLDSSITLKKVKDELFNDTTTQEIVDHIRKNIFKEINQFTIDQICAKLEITRQELLDNFNTNDDFLRNNLNDTLQLLLRCEHVFEEAERVEKFKSICDTTIDISLLGQLMTQSHYSLRDKYDCSHPALDRLVGVALDAGALGSRLTGAGWGGCVVTLVETAKCDTVFERLAEVSKFTFRTEPQAGSNIIEIPVESQ